MIENLTPEDQANFNGALLGILVQRGGGSVRITTDEFDAFMRQQPHLETVAEGNEITLTLRSQHKNN